MFKKLFSLMVLLILCSSCVSRTTYKTNVEDGSKSDGESKLVWFWNDDF